MRAITQRDREGHLNREGTYHDERLLHAEDGVARDVGVAVGVQRGRELLEAGRLDHHVQVVRAHVVAAEVEEEIADGALPKARSSAAIDWAEGMRRTSPGMGYATGTTAR